MPKPTTPTRVLRSRATEFQTRTRRRDDSETEDLVIEGYMVVFDQPYYVDELTEEVIDRHAFDAADQADVRALVDHLTHLVLGRSTAGTLTYTIDDYGIYCTILINPADQDAMNLYARVQRGDVNQASFGFDEDWEAGDWTDLPDGRARWTVRRVTKLWEVSVCTFPAYEQTYVESRRADAEAWRARRRAADQAERKARLLRHLKHYPRA